ncbi:MAG: Ig-like domain-containing protein, partial [Cyanobacteria bacterium J06607_13]
VKFAPVFAFVAIETDDILNAFEAASDLPITGTTDAEPGQTVAVNVNGIQYTSTVQPDGTWSVTVPPAELANLDPVETITAQVSDIAGNPAPQATRQLTVDTTAPSAPMVEITEDLNNDGFINDTELAGTVEAKVTVGPDVVVGDTLVVTNQSGTELFSGPITQDHIDNGVQVSTTAPANDQPVTFTASVTDPAGNSSPEGTATAVLDTIAPNAPTAPDLVAASDSGLSDTDEYTSDNTPTFAGSVTSADPGDTLTLYVDGVALATTTLDANGNYTLTVPDAAPLADGPIDVSVTTTDAAGNESSPSAVLPVVIDTIAPTALAIDGPIAGNDVVGNAEQQSVVINGQQAEPTSTVEVTFSDGVTTLGPVAATVNSDGTWSTPGTNLSSLNDGNITVSVVETDLAGNADAATTAEFTKEATSSNQGSGGSDVITGGDGNNIINGLSDDDTLDGGGGDDVVNGGSDLDVMLGGTGNDVLNGGSSGDVIEAGDGNDIINGGSGDDVAYGEAGIDVMNGGSGDDTLYGGLGNDLLTGGSDDDLLFGGAGRDLLRGGSGNDVLNGGEGDDFLSGGQGSDIFVYTQTSEFGDVISDFEHIVAATSSEQVSTR